MFGWLFQGSYILNLLSDGSSSRATARAKEIATSYRPINRFVAASVTCSINLKPIANSAIFTDAKIVDHVSFEDLFSKWFLTAGVRIPDKCVTSLFESDFNSPHI